MSKETKNKSFKLLQTIEMHDDRRKKNATVVELMRQEKMKDEKMEEKKRTDRINTMLSKEEKKRRKRAVSLELDSFTAEKRRSLEKQEKTNIMKQKSIVKEEIRRVGLQVATDEMKRQQMVMLQCIQEKNLIVEKNLVERRKRKKKDWLSPKMFGKCMIKRSTGGAGAGAGAGSTAGSTAGGAAAAKMMKKKTKKKKKEQNQDEHDLVTSTFISPVLLLPSLHIDVVLNDTTDDETTIGGDNNSSDRDMTTIHPDIERLINIQRHQMALLLDEEELQEKERTASLKRSKQIRKKQVSKHFDFKRIQAVQRVERMKMEHQLALDAAMNVVIKNS